MRIVLAIFVVFVQVAGPWLCCCASACVVDKLANAETTSTAPTKPTVCPHCKPADDTPAPSEPVPPHDPESCPCGGVELLAVADERQKAATLETVVLAELFSIPAPFPAVLSCSVAALPGLRELPILTTEDRLFTHHVLRC